MTTLNRDRVGWWVYVLALGGMALFIGHSFVGVLALGLFGYYATRPICDRLSTVIDSESIAAVLAVLTVLAPVLLVGSYVGYRILQRLQQNADEGVVSMLVSQFMGLRAVPGTEDTDPTVLLQRPPSLDQLPSMSSGSVLTQALNVLNATFGTLLLIGLAIALAYALLEYDESLSDGFATLAGGRDTTVYRYAIAVDNDLESIFFGNLLFAVIMSIVATVTYAATNLVAPPGIRVPMVFTLGFLTGVASLIPVVVGKVVYLPIVAYLALQATERGGVGFAFVGGALVVYVFVLDLLPQSFVQPYVSGREINAILLLFAYILGPMLFGWYGFFLMPILFVLMLETTRIVLPELLRAEPIAPDVKVAKDTGADPEEVSEETLDSDDTDPSAEQAEPAPD